MKFHFFMNKLFGVLLCVLVVMSSVFFVCVVLNENDILPLGTISYS